MRSPLAVLFMVVFIDLLGFGIVIPILPLYAESFGASGMWVGILMASFSLMQFLISPFWGRLSDRHGRRKILLYTMAGGVIAYTLNGAATSLMWLLAGRILSGVFAANISTAYAYVTDITTNETRSKGMGVMGAAMGLGFTIGPAIGGFLATHFGLGSPMYFAAGLVFINIIYGYFALPVAVPKDQGERIGFIQSLELLKNKLLAVPITLFFFMSMALTQMEVILVLYLQDRFHLTAEHNGYIFGMSGVLMVLVQAKMISPLSKRFGEIPLVLFTSLLGAAGMFALGFADTVLLIVVYLSVLAIARGILQPALSSLTSRGTAEKTRGLSLGHFHSAGSLARILGPLLAGQLYDHFSHVAPFFAGSVLLLICSLVTFLYPKSSVT